MLLGSTQPGVLPWARELAAIAELGLSALWGVKDIGRCGSFRAAIPREKFLLPVC